MYKEGLSGVIAPTIKSIKQAISTYELQGGTANILINDDGLQLYRDENEHLRKERIDFYADHNIGWVARPPHGKDGFQRKGKFKKVSETECSSGCSKSLCLCLDGKERRGLARDEVDFTLRSSFSLLFLVSPAIPALFFDSPMRYFPDGLSRQAGIFLALAQALSLAFLGKYRSSNK